MLCEHIQYTTWALIIAGIAFQLQAAFTWIRVLTFEKHTNTDTKPKFV